jgi:hypothetical protein
MKPKVFYFATLGSRIEVDDEPLKDIEGEKEKITDPLSFGIYEVFKKWQTLPYVTMFYTAGNGGSENNLLKIKRKLSNLTGHIEGVEIYPYDIDKNNVKLNNFFSEKFKEINKEDNFRVIVNPTTGTNPMVISLFSAVINNFDKIEDLYKLRIVYIKEFKDGRKEGVRGDFESMETVDIKVNEIKNYILLKKCRGLIEENKFDHAYLLLKTLHSKEPLLKAVLECFCHLALGLHYWDEYNHQRALSELSYFLKLYNDLKENYPLKEEFIGDIKRKVRYLKEKRVSSEKLTIFHVIDLFNNHKRRLNENRFLDSTIRLYRSIELYLEFILKQHDFDVQKPNFSKFTEKERKDIITYYKIVCEGFKEHIEPERIFNGRIYFKEMAALLMFFKNKDADEFFKVMPLEEIIAINTIRNTSYLTHGLGTVIQQHGDWRRIPKASGKIETYFKERFPKEFEITKFDFSL